ncbi:MAG: CRISPR-associated helicase/endonuclease Cas3, partial [Deltaproteobacteria bacterium]|nr:CRISPR-associated helicase/endonuclease Cas3 [Deltaproteobacteria bacterium]
QTRELFELIGDEDAHFHLSTYMHAAHRSKVLQEIRERLNAGLKCRVVSTQLVEAGVDIDFPTVYRNEAGIDSIAQAAGRCNREGKRVDGGRMFVFKSEKQPPAGLLRQSADAGNQTARLHSDDILSLDAVKTYFSHFYWKRSQGNGLDKKCIIDTANEDCPNLNFPFESLAKDYCLIENDTTGIIIPCDTNAELIEELRKGYYPDRLIIRKLQRYMVQVRKEVLADLINAGAIEDIFGDYSILLLSNTLLYDDKKIGLNTEQSYNYDVESLII